MTRPIPFGGVDTEQPDRYTLPLETNFYRVPIDDME